jgi:hypothetical protein
MKIMKLYTSASVQLKKPTFFQWKFTLLLRTFVITGKLVSVQKIMRNYEPKLLRVSRNYDVEVHKNHEITHFPHPTPTVSSFLHAIFEYNRLLPFILPRNYEHHGYELS